MLVRGILKGLRRDWRTAPHRRRNKRTWQNIRKVASRQFPMDQVNGHSESIPCKEIVVVEIRKVPKLASENPIVKYYFHRPDVG
jgi:hypothetical protein